MVLESSKRRVLMQKLYRRPFLEPHQVFALINHSIKTKQGISVIRLGDVMAKLLSKKDLPSLKRVAPFIGISYPPSPQLLTDLDRTVRQAHVVGVTYFPGRAKQLQSFMKKKNWTPPHFTDSFINDLMYNQGYMHQLIRKHRVALVGRSARKAARQLKKKGLHVAMVVDLDHYDRLPEAYTKLKRQKNRWDLALVGASVPGRILCVALTKQLNKTSFEIGHMMDALANPKDWRRHQDRARFKKHWIRILAKKKK